MNTGANTKTVWFRNKQGNTVPVTMYWSPSFGAYVSIPGAVRSSGGTLKPAGQRTIVRNERGDFAGYTVDSMEQRRQSW